MGLLEDILGRGTSPVQDLFGGVSQQRNAQQQLGIPLAGLTAGALAEPSPLGEIALLGLIAIQMAKQRQGIPTQPPFQLPTMRSFPQQQGLPQREGIMPTMIQPRPIGREPPPIPQRPEGITRLPTTFLPSVLKAKKPTEVKKSIHELSLNELDDLIDKTIEEDKNLEIRLFGEEGAKKYKTLSRIANSSIADVDRIDKAADELARMEDALTEKEQNELFGIGQEGVVDIEQLKSLRRAIGGIEGDTPQELGETIGIAITRVGDKTNPAEMSPSELEAFMQIKKAFEISKEKGFNTKEVSDSAIRASASRFSDPNDALFMLRRFLKPQFIKGFIPKL